MLDSSNFKYFERFDKIDSEEHFNKLINLAIRTYFEILNTKTYIKSEMIRGTVLFHTDASVLYLPFRFIQRMLLSEILFIAP